MDYNVSDGSMSAPRKFRFIEINIGLLSVRHLAAFQGNPAFVPI